MRSHSIHRCHGFSIVELMVGVAIALIGIILMFKVLHDWEGRKRTTSAGSDAQVAGSIGMFSLERDIKNAGYGFGDAASALMGCNVSGWDSLRTGNVFAFQMVPVLITNGGNSPDTVAVLYGNGTTVSAARPFSAISGGATGETITADNVDGLKPGDLLIAAQPGTPPQPGNALCGLFETTTSQAGVSVPITLAAIDRYNGGTPRGPTAGGMLFNLGPAPQLNIWSVSSDRRLTMESRIANGQKTDVAEGIVDLRAQYGLDINADGIVETWTVTAPTDWRTVLAIRVALLARSQQYEKTSVTPDSDFPVWSGSVESDTNPVAHPFVMTTPDATAVGTPDDWHYYRYRVYETVIPLRNIVWGAGGLIP
jgi:type IV pilus assembly protein PilW